MFYSEVYSEKRDTFLPDGYVLNDVHYRWDEETGCYVSPFGSWTTGIPREAKVDVTLAVGRCTICEEWLKKDGSIETRSFKATISWIDDRGEYWYVGYRPLEPHICEFGCFRVYKDRLCKCRNMFVAEY